MTPIQITLIAGAAALVLLFAVAWWRYERPRPKQQRGSGLRTFYTRTELED